MTLWFYFQVILTLLGLCFSIKSTINSDSSVLFGGSPLLGWVIGSVMFGRWCFTSISFSTFRMIFVLFDHLLSSGKKELLGFSLSLIITSLPSPDASLQWFSV